MQDKIVDKLQLSLTCSPEDLYDASWSNVRIFDPELVSWSGSPLDHYQVISCLEFILLFQADTSINEDFKIDYTILFKKEREKKVVSLLY